MNRLPLLTPDTVEPGSPTADLLKETLRQLGKVPNLYAALANSPAALSGYLAMRDKLTEGVLTPRLREQLALLTAQENGCTYCVSAHTLRGKRILKMTDEELLATRDARDDGDPHADAVLKIARQIVRTSGRVDDEAIAAARAARVTDAELAEIVAHIALNVLSNFFNHLAEPELDFPEVKA